MEIFSDLGNCAIMRHPGRKFPGVLLQGDTLYSLCVAADLSCKSMGPSSPAFEEANELRNRLWSMLNHYKVVLIAGSVVKLGLY
jgi:hypothetical protein